MPGYDPSLPGELNKYASLDADLCVDFNLTGRCVREEAFILGVPMSRWVVTVPFATWSTPIRSEWRSCIVMVA